MRTFIVGCIMIGLAGCASTSGQSEPLRLLPDIDCTGKITLSATGALSVSAFAGVNNSNSGTLIADCGDGFRLLHNGVAK